MSEKIKDVEKMIAKVMKKKDLTSRTAAVDYMLVVATGRLAALWRYDDSLPEGKSTKGILALAGRKKPAPKTPKIALPDEDRQAKAAARMAERAAKPKRVRKAKPKASRAEQTEIAAE